MISFHEAFSVQHDAAVTLEHLSMAAWSLNQPRLIAALLNTQPGSEYVLCWKVTPCGAGCMQVVSWRDAVEMGTKCSSYSRHVFLVSTTTTFRRFTTYKSDRCSRFRPVFRGLAQKQEQSYYSLSDQFHVRFIIPDLRPT